MRVLVAMSGGVDSSVAAALMLRAGHEVTGTTLKLWGGASDSGCCSVSDVEDARRVAEQLGITHHVFNFAGIFEETVVGPYAAQHAVGRTPNPCIECNRHVKFGALLERAKRLGFDALCTGHHARIGRQSGRSRLLRGVDRQKDQSYVLSMLTCAQLASLELPVGALTKTEVRAHAAYLGLRTAAKPDSQDVCFIHSDQGRAGFLAQRMQTHTGELVDVSTSKVVGEVPAVELVTVGQRRGLGTAGDGKRRFALSVDVHARRVMVGPASAARSSRVEVSVPTWVDDPLPEGATVFAQTSAHGRSLPGRWFSGSLVFDEPQRLVAPGQTIALYDPHDPDSVLGSVLVTSAVAA